VPKIKLHPQNIILDAPKRCNLLAFLQSQGIPVGSACGGKGLCASCKITVLSGEKNLSRPNDRELDLTSRNGLQLKERISCQSKVLGDIEITTSYW
jgi:Na+-transporting NADH:ubiquinone oxidoreductase subunit F